MKNLFISYQLAVTAKQKGFKEPTMAMYDESGNFVFLPYNESDINAGELMEDLSSDVEPGTTKLFANFNCAAPLYQQIVDWFRIKHNIVVQVDVFDYGFLEKEKPCFQWRIYNKSDAGDKVFVSSTESLSPYIMWDEAIEEAFKLI